MKAERLKRSEDFHLLRKHGVSVATASLKLSALAGNEKRIGIITPKHVGIAVTRNRLKRVIREHFRTSSGLYPRAHIAVVMKKRGTKLPNQELRQELETALLLLQKKIGKKT